MTKVEELRDLAQSIREIGMCLCAVGHADLAEKKPCPNCQKAADLRAEADRIEAGEAA